MEPQAQAQPRPKELDLKQEGKQEPPSSQARRVAGSHKETPSPSKCCQGEEVCILIYSIALAEGGRARSFWSLAHDSFPPGAAGRGRAYAPAASGQPHTPACSFIYGALSGTVHRGDKVYEKRRRLRRRAGPGRSFPTLIRISQGFGSGS